MKETIGKKIKRLRKKSGLTQENVHYNQSQISQIESGRITNPDENTLLLIAKNMEMTFDALIDETTWVKPESTLKSKEIAFSPAIVDVEIDDNGNISWSHKSYPLYNEKGEKAEHCLETGLKLIDSCENCRRQVENVKQEYCIGCGKRLMETFNIPNLLREVLGNRLAFDLYHECNNAIAQIDQELNDVQNLLMAIEAGKRETSDKEIDPNAKWNFLIPVPPIGQLKIYQDLITNCFTEKKLVPDYVKNQINFDIQLYEAARKKLISIAENLQKPDDMEEMKINLFATISAAISDQLDVLPAFGQQSESEPKEKPSLQTLMQMLKDVEISEDTEELISRLQSKIDFDTYNREQFNKVQSKSEELMSTLQSIMDPKVETEDDSDDEKISEDGNFETDAAEKADRNNKNAKNKNKKEA